MIRRYFGVLNRDEAPESSGWVATSTAAITPALQVWDATIEGRDLSPYPLRTLILIPTAESPHYVLIIAGLLGGRRLLSDDVAMLDAVGLVAARQIDALRVTHERCQRSLREQEISKLATEAELRALRAQINPHFLFNALTTIGYLIQTSSSRALATLMRLTELLRRVLKNSGEFVTLGEELDLVESYLDIERARFEERLTVNLAVPVHLRAVRVPALLLQPLVENAVKHGIAPNRAGGTVSISASMDVETPRATRDNSMICISVKDTGIGATQFAVARGRERGFGLANVEQRLNRYYGDEASLAVTSTPGKGTAVEVRLPLRSRDGLRTTFPVAALGKQ